MRRDIGCAPIFRNLLGFRLLPEHVSGGSLPQKVPMRTIKDMTIETRKVVLDEIEFIRCNIRHCEIHYSGGEHSLVDTKIEGCTWAFHGAAQRTANLIKGFGLSRLGAADANVLASKPQ